MKHLLKLADLSAAEITEILNVADQLKYEKKNGVEHHLLKGKTLGMIFSKSSTRTRVSFEVGMHDLGGNALFLSSRDLQIGRGEPVEDLAKYGSIPIINGLTDYCHPCQVLADLMTIREYKGTLAGKKLCFVGDGNNVANSLLVGCVTMGMKVAMACPAGHEPYAALMQWAAGTGRFLCTPNVDEAIQDADAVYTDVWASMGQEQEAEERRRVFAPYQVNAANMALAKPDAMVMHCLPAHRGEEITAEVFEQHAGELFDEAENRLHVQKAILAKCLGAIP